jgi:hypothetical protein
MEMKSHQKVATSQLVAKTHPVINPAEVPVPRPKSQHKTDKDRI